MNWYKLSMQEDVIKALPGLAMNTDNATLDRVFDNINTTEVVSKDAPSSKKITINLYRGFNGDLNKFQKDTQGNFIFSPRKSEQGVLWFSRSLDVALGRGEHLLTYPLTVTKHFQKVNLSNGSSYEDVPDEILSLSKPTENCRFYGGIELPEGWLFSYKVEKHIICTKDISVATGMIKNMPGGDT